jgi:hypothetical protein
MIRYKLKRQKESVTAMAQSFDPAPLGAFFDEVNEQFGIKLKYLPDNAKYPIQLENAPEGVSRVKCVEVLQFIKGQVDLRDNEIGQLYASKKGGKFLLDISMQATQALADVYALSFFYPHEQEEEDEKEEKPAPKPKASKSKKTPPPEQHKE